MSQRVGEQTAPAHSMALPAAASNAAFLARLQEPFSSSETLCHVWKGSSLAPLSGLQRGCPQGQEGLEACSHVQPWPSSLSALLSAGFSLQGWCHVPHLSTDASFRDPGCQAPMSGFGDQPLLPPLTQRQTLGHSAAQTREGWLGVWVVFQQVQSGLTGCCCLANSHQTSPLHWPQLYSFLWTKRVGSPSPWGLGVKQLLLTEP